MDIDLFEYQVKKVKYLIQKLFPDDKIDRLAIQRIMCSHQMSVGYHRSGLVYDRLCDDGFLIRDCKNLGAYYNKGGEK